MLQLIPLVPRIEQMATTRRDHLQALRDLMGAAQRALHDLARSPGGLPTEQQQPELALPTDEPLDAIYPAPRVPDEWTVLAVDGSQIEPSFHEAVSWGLLQASEIVIQYGEGAWAVSHAAVQIFDPFDAADEDDGAPLSVAERRQAFELRQMRDVLGRATDYPAPVALTDGPLVRWRWAPLPKAASGHPYQEMLSAALEAQIPVAGYISRSRSQHVVKLLAKYGGLGANHDGLTDGMVLGPLLPNEADRSAVFHSNAQELREVYGAEHHDVGFFYMRAGGEIARVEVPSWVWREPTMLNRVHAAVARQAELGHGYPLALSEAHERACVRAAEREQFYRLVERVLRERGENPSLSAKASRKLGALA